MAHHAILGQASYTLLAALLSLMGVLSRGPTSLCETMSYEKRHGSMPLLVPEKVKTSLTQRGEKLFVYVGINAKAEVLGPPDWVLNRGICAVLKIRVH